MTKQLWLYEIITIKLQKTYKHISTWPLLGLTDGVWNWTKLNPPTPNFTNKYDQYVPVRINNGPMLSQKNISGWLSAINSAGECLSKKCEQLVIKFIKMCWLLERSSKLSIYTKLLLCKQIPKPVWTYGIQLLGYTRKRNIEEIQNKVLRNIIDAPRYCRNSGIHRNLQMDSVNQNHIQICQ